jgi:hypothetical protein
MDEKYPVLWMANKHPSVDAILGSANKSNSLVNNRSFDSVYHLLLLVHTTSV